VDESQNLADSVLETVRLLSNFETSYAKMLQIVLAGQPQLSDKLAQPQLAQLRQRLAVLAELEPLSPAETANYIDHRLKVAGYDGAPLFTPEAVALVARMSGGTPRTINHLCYSALTAGHAQAREVIDADIVQEVAAKLGLSARSDASVTPEPKVLAAAAGATAGSGSGQTAPHTAMPAQPSEKVEETIALKGASALTYQPPRRFRMPKWASRALILSGILFLAGVSLTAFMLRLTEADQDKARTSVPGQLSRPGHPVPGAAEPSSRAPHFQDAARPGTNYSADPQERGSVQVITVAAMPKQTLRDISLVYIGRFNDGIFKQICALNPELKDPKHLEAGQLIRLPLPAGSFKQGKVFTPEE